MAADFIRTALVVLAAVGCLFGLIGMFTGVSHRILGTSVVTSLLLLLVRMLMDLPSTVGWFVVASGIIVGARILVGVRERGRRSRTSSSFKRLSDLNK